jgi:uncharacterized membrane protein YbhN (UPF0104 family)
VVLLVLCGVTILLLVQLSQPPAAMEQALEGVAAALPSFLDVLWSVGSGAATLWSVTLVLTSLLRRRLDIFRDHLLAIAATLVVAEGVLTMIGTDSRGFWTNLTATSGPADPVSVRLAIITATMVVASPHIARPFRTLGRWLVGIGLVSLVALEAVTPSGGVLGILCGATGAALVHLAFGSNAGRPSIDAVRRALDEIGVEVATLSEATRQRAGVFRLDGTDPEGRPLVVKLYGRDAWDTQLLAKGWRALWYRDAEALTLTRLQQAEHEGFVTLLAARNGVPTPDVVRAGRSSTNDALLVLRTRGHQLEPAPGAFDPATLTRLWDTALALGAAGFAHGHLSPARFRLDGDDVVVGGLAGASLAPTGDQRRVDLAQLIATSALLAGPDAAVAMAADRLGTDGLAEVVPYLQPAGLGTVLRSELADADLDLDELREQVAAAAGVEDPKLAQLRRVSPSTLIQAGLIVLAAYILISTIANVDMAELVAALQTASIPILFVALLFAQTPRFAQAESTRAACPRPLPYGPVVLLQFAITFVNLVIPSTAARVAVNIRFFQRQGIPPASAVSIGAIDGFAGFVVQMLILASVLLFGFGDVDLSLDTSSAADGGQQLLSLLVVLAVVAVVVVLAAIALPKSRAWVIERVRPWYQEAIDTLGSLRSPSRVARVLGANLGSELLFAITLAIVCAAFGTSLPLATLLVINVATSLFAGLMPVPGGIGVAEGALVAGLTAAGVDQATAFGIAIAYRICTFYLPPVWGSVAFHRLERNGLL